MGAYNDIDIEERPVFYENEIGSNALVASRVLSTVTVQKLQRNGMITACSVLCILSTTAKSLRGGLRPEVYILMHP